MTTLVFLIFQSRSESAITEREHQKHFTLSSVSDAPLFTLFSGMKI